MIFTPASPRGIVPGTTAAVLYQSVGADVAWDWLTTRENPYRRGSGYLNVQLAYEKMRRVALAEQYSAVWVVEADMLPPVNALRLLLETDAPVVTGVYPLRHGVNVPNLWTLNEGVAELGSGMEWATLRAALARGETVLPTSGGCMGCVLIRPEALDFSFDLVATNPAERRAPDIAWMRHNRQQGRVTTARLDVLCGHVDADGRVLRPEEFLSL